MPKVVQLFPRLQNGHTLVVGSKHRTHVQTGQRPVHHDEQSRLPPRQEGEQNAEVQRQPGHNGGYLGDGVANALPPRQISETSTQQAEGSQQEHRVEEERLVLHQKAQGAALFHGLLFRKCEDGYLYVAIRPQVVGVAVMSIVLVLPPAWRHACDQPSQQHHHIVVAGGTEYLPVAGIVPDEPELREHDSKEHCVEHLHP